MVTRKFVTQLANGATCLEVETSHATGKTIKYLTHAGQPYDRPIALDQNGKAIGSRRLRQIAVDGTMPIDPKLNDPTVAIQGGSSESAAARGVIPTHRDPSPGEPEPSQAIVEGPIDNGADTPPQIPSAMRKSEARLDRHRTRARGKKE